MEATASILFSHLRSSLRPPSFSLLSNLPHSPKPSPPSSTHFPRISHSTLALPLKFPLCPSSNFRPIFALQCSAESAVVLEETPDETEALEKAQKRKLFIFNFPWSLSPDDLKKAFSECGTVREAEIIKNKDGKFRGFAFITMSSGEEAQAVVDKFDGKELGGRIIKVEFSRRLKKPRPQPEPTLPIQETRHKLYVSNLQWKARSSHLREFFSADSIPVSARVVFENPNGRSAGYGFVSFSTREEAESAISSLNGKELLGRPVIVKFSESTSEDEVVNEEGKEEEKENQDGSVSPVVEEEVSEAEPAS